MTVISVIIAVIVIGGLVALRIHLNKKKETKAGKGGGSPRPKTGEDKER